MKKKTFKDFFDEVAFEWGYMSFSNMLECDPPEDGNHIPTGFYQRVAELYAEQEKKAYATEAVKKDRDRIFGEFNILHDHDQIAGLAYINHLSEIQENLPIELP